jgi:hypothetical protein
MAKRHRRLDEELVQGALLDRPLSLPQPRKDERTEYQNGGRENEQGEAKQTGSLVWPCSRLIAVPIHSASLTLSRGISTGLS